MELEELGGPPLGLIWGVGIEDLRKGSGSGSCIRG